jgi:hypothetical protein
MLMKIKYLHATWKVSIVKRRVITVAIDEEPEEF